MFSLLSSAKIVAFRPASLLLSGMLIFSTSAPGIKEVGNAFNALVTKLEREIKGPYSDAPQHAYLGSHPGRTPRTRGGIWSDEQLAMSEEVGSQANASAAVGRLTATAYSPAQGTAFPWEGASPSITGSGILNTGNGKA